MDEKIKITTEGKSVVATHKNKVIRKWDTFFYFSTKLVLQSLSRPWHEKQLTEEEFKSKNPLFSFVKKDVLSKVYRAYLIKNNYSSFKEEYGITASTARKIINSKMKEIWVVDPYLFTKFCFNLKRKPSADKVHRLSETVDLLKQVKIKNHLPLVFYFGVKESELPSLFGEDSWKEISKNSEYRNHVLCKRVCNISADSFLPQNRLEYAKRFKEFNKIKKTGALEKFYYESNFELIYIVCNIFKIKEIKDICSSKCFGLPLWGQVNSSDHYNLFVCIKDFLDLAKKHKYKYDINWTREQWEKTLKTS